MGVDSLARGIIGHMEYQRTSHAVYEFKYHLVWVPKDRKYKFVDRADIGEYLEGVRKISKESLHSVG